MYDVRPLTDADAVAAWDLGRLAFGYGHDEPTPSSRPEPTPDDVLSRWGAFDETGRLVAKVVDLHHEQWWGGALLAASGIAGVAVQPEHRGRGAGRTALTAALHGARERGAVVAALFCTSTAVYRAVGFEVGGVLRTVALPTDALSRTPVDGLVMRAGTGRDWPAVRAIYDGVARHGNGLLSRNGRLFDDPSGDELPDGIDGLTLACDESGAAIGYATWQRGQGYDDRSVLTVHDCLARRPDAARGLLAVLAGWGTVTPTVRLRMLPWFDGVTAVLPLERVREHKAEVWMHRPLDVAAATAARGWAAAADASVAFRLVDRDLPWNDAAWRLDVKGGEARLEPATGEPELRLDVRGWSLLWCGAARSAQLRPAGLLAGGDAGLDAQLDATLGSGGPAGAYDYF
jgi:predicted acetyltransferase